MIRGCADESPTAARFEVKGRGQECPLHIVSRLLGQDGHIKEPRGAKTEMFQSGYHRGNILISRLQYPGEAKHLCS